MNALFYRLQCLSNLHMGSSDVNYTIVDLEVERDPVLLEPTMNASGIKGALRDYCNERAPKKIVTEIFGSEKSGQTAGSYHFFSGDLLARPVRVSDGNVSYVLATSPELLHAFLHKLKTFGLRKLLPEGELPSAEEVAKQPLCGCDCTEVEGIAVTPNCTNTLLTALLGTSRWVVLTPAQLAAIDLPVQAHNILENKISQNLWYEEYVPHQSIFGLVVLPSDDGTMLRNILGHATVVQFGAGASTGCGFVCMEEMEAPK